MPKPRRPIARPRKAYQLPENEYRALLRARDQLRLYAILLEPYAFEEGRALPISHLALPQCFRRVADDLDDIAVSAWWPR